MRGWVRDDWGGWNLIVIASSGSVRACVCVETETKRASER